MKFSELAAYLDDLTADDPVLANDALYQRNPDIVYAAAHHAFAFLVLRYGEQTVLQVLASMRQGRVFPEAFNAVIGVTPEAFTTEFKQYVRQRGR